MSTLKRLSGFSGCKGPVLVVVMDGVGIGPENEGNAVRAAATPTLDRLNRECVHTSLKAHGTAVGLPSDEDMGNSEVGHNAIGAGRVFAQGARLVNDAIDSGRLWRTETWKELVGGVKESGGALHFIGLFSDGNVHSHIRHLQAMLKQAKAEGVATVRVHILLDGRDVGEKSALEYVLPFEAFLKELNASGGDYAVASGGGRMKVTMDRYEADWNMVKLGWETHVQGKGERFASAEQAIRAIRERDPAVTDQFLPAFVIERNGQPLGPIRDGDSVIFFNFRGDRAIEISRAFEDEAFDKFDRGARPRVRYAGMMQYDGDLKIPARFLVSPPVFENTLGQTLARAGVTQLAISETQKFGHVTYFWNGNWSGKFDEKSETYVEIPSDRVPFEQRPWMKSAEITDRLIGELRSGKHRFGRVNYANGDMVGHTGVFRSAVMGVEAVDLALSRLLPVIASLDGAALITADHGNSDEMFETDKKGRPKTDAAGNPVPKTAHTLNPVPFILYAPSLAGRFRLSDVTGAGLSRIAATCLNFLGFEAPAEYDPSLVTFT
ncbi:MAG: 2,3-bisphosphoglycerate-independent phosphoglycerate mutase [bacterium]|nr:2,3-bisphosphoglycerate-independent phosphoglycerate mutase [bacterium]